MDHTETIDLGPQPNDPETLPDLGGERVYQEGADVSPGPGR